MKIVTRPEKTDLCEFIIYVMDDVGRPLAAIEVNGKKQLDKICRLMSIEHGINLIEHTSEYHLDLCDVFDDKFIYF